MPWTHTASLWSGQKLISIFFYVGSDILDMADAVGRNNAMIAYEKYN